MSNDIDISTEELTAGLSKIRKLRWFFWITIILYLPTMLLSMQLSSSGQGLVIAFILWILVLIVAVALLSLVRCPRCGNCFHMSGFSFRPVRKCFHCKLHLTADK